MNNLEQTMDSYYQRNKEKLKLKRKEYYERNKDIEKLRAKSQRENIPKETKLEYAKTHYEKNKASILASHKKQVLANWENYLYKTAKARARRTGLDFNLETSDIIIPEYCPYLGIKLTRELGNGRIESNPSIDRIDNNLGYNKGNIQIISSKANRMKSNASIEELINFSRNVIKLYVDE